ncbi:prepilin-type N-terminal cleavage/methylation domain-containing protein [Pelagicoccus sp. NFK12]|uniref:Prepilin-type N-terminal cleavage/methylation domain-containing protein n=1 Tax=Pelagicoccus enzymogenes TaxID=2773457 RepID=A0A927IG47_9BACT|nr:prepilin-type N-terminal cleavage/methylation domain-containing protein [Pelagicoccus enzymogenes]MBD5778439.1 prepilin-type N-terminal cleavage/methylation domain-containing protein [Pelagicoccus enzymogenes]
MRLGKSRPGSGGFTLLEVLVALALFFMAVTFFSMTYLNTLMAIEGTRLNQGLEQDMAAIRRQALLIADVEELEEGGEVVTGEHGLARWRVEYEPTQVADLFLVTLSVELDPDDKEKGATEATEQFYLTRPSWSEPTERDELRAETKERLLDRQLNIRQ